MNIDQVRTLVHRLYSSTDPNEVKSIQENLQSIQRQLSAWKIASELLQSESSECQFFGALTFQVKITRDWNTLPEENIEPLREELINDIARTSLGKPFVTKKLCLALIFYAFQAVPDHWSNIVEDVDTCLREKIPSRQPILEFLTLLPEEIANVDIVGGKRLQLNQELKTGTPLAIAIISELLLSSAVNVNISSQKAALKCFKSWIQFGINLEDVSALLQEAMRLVGNPELFEEASEVLLEAMQQPKWATYVSLRDGLLLYFTSKDMQDLCDACIHEEDDETGKTLAKLFTAFGEMFVEFISMQLANQQIMILMNMILRLTNFSGLYPVDQEVTEIPLNFWYVLQETLCDNGIIPLREPETAISTFNEEGIVSDDSSPTLEQQEWTYQCGKRATELYRDLVIILQQKAAYPANEVWNSWSKDIKWKFQSLRRDLEDTMINPYYVLRGDMLKILMENAIKVLHQWDNTPLPSQSIEASLFCIKSVSEEVVTEEIGNIAHFFNTEILNRLQLSGNIRLQNTVLLLIGTFSEWLKTAPEHLASVLGFVIPCLNDPGLAVAAATTFTKICDACRVQLTDNLDSLLTVYRAASQANLSSNTMQKVIESVADVIQALPLDRAITPLMSLTENILTSIITATDGALSEPNAARDTVIIQLHYLTACCKGLQPPNDDYQSLSARNTMYDAFASGQLASTYTYSSGHTVIVAAIQKSVQDVTAMWSSDELVMKALTDFLKSGIRSTSPLITLPFKDLVILIKVHYKRHPFACWLDIATLTMNVYGGQEKNYQGLCGLLSDLSETTLNFIHGTADMEEHPDVIDNYFGLLSQVIRRCPKIFYQLPESMIHYIFLFSIAGMSLQERLALRAALNFMADFVCSSEDEGSRAAETITENIEKIIEELLLGISGRVPRSFSAPLVDVLYKLTVRFTPACRQCLHRLLSQEEFPTPLVEKKDKEVFMKGILGTRSLKRFKEYTHAFSVKCRGLSNTRFRSGS